MSAKLDRSVARPTYEQIAEAAYLIWLTEGRPAGRDAEHWTQAEKQLIADRMQEAVRKAPPHSIANVIAQALFAITACTT